MVMGESAFVRLPVVLILLVVGKEGLFVEIRARRGSESFLLIIKGLRVDVVLNSADDVLIIFYMMVIFGSMSFSSCGQGIHIFIHCPLSAINFFFFMVFHIELFFLIELFLLIELFFLIIIVMGVDDFLVA